MFEKVLDSIFGYATEGCVNYSIKFAKQMIESKEFRKIYDQSLQELKVKNEQDLEEIRLIKSDNIDLYRDIEKIFKNGMPINLENNIKECLESKTNLKSSTIDKFITIITLKLLRNEKSSYRELISESSEINIIKEIDNKIDEIVEGNQKISANTESILKELSKEPLRPLILQDYLATSRVYCFLWVSIDSEICDEDIEELVENCSEEINIYDENSGTYMEMNFFEPKNSEEIKDVLGIIDEKLEECGVRVFGVYSH